MGSRFYSIMPTKKRAKVRERKESANKRLESTVKKVVQGKPLSIAMKESGYKPSYAKNPQYLARTDSFRKELQRVMTDNGITLDRLTQVHSKLLDSPREDIQARAVETGYKLHGVYDKAHSGSGVQAVQINIIPPDMADYKDIMEGGGDTTT
jgi:hypothetical protein